MNDLNMEALLDMTGIPTVNEDEMEIVHPPLVLVDVESHPENRTIDLDDDYSAARRMMAYAEQMSLDLAKIVLENAKNSESPRHAEVAVQTINQLMTNAKERLKIHKEMKDITNQSVGAGTAAPAQGTVIDATVTVFEGTPNDLMNQEGSQMESVARLEREAKDD
ncbi:MAG: terminase small subunit [Culicoidibacterales bacterium]